MDFITTFSKEKKILQACFLLLISALAYFFTDRLWVSNNDCFIIHVGKIFDGVNPVYQMDKKILIRNGLIEDIFEGGSPQYKCKNIDLKHHVALPGLIDAHTHLLLIPTFHSEMQTDSVGIIRKSSSIENKIRLEFGKRNALSMLHAGFTTIRDLGNSGQFLDEQLAKYALEKPMLSPFIIYSGPGISGTGTQAGPNLSSEYRQISNKQQIDLAIAENIQHKATWLKVYADNDGYPGVLSDELFSYAIESAHKNNLKVAVHSTVHRDFGKISKFAPDSIEHFLEIPKHSIQGINSKFFVITDFNLDDCRILRIQSNDSRFQDCKNYMGELIQRTKWAIEHRMTPVFGSDSYFSFGFSRGKSALRSLESLLEQGLSPFQTLQAATVNAAKLLGLPQSGIIAVGAKADILVVSGDPLSSIKDLQNTMFVMKAGQIICHDQPYCK